MRGEEVYEIVEKTKDFEDRLENKEQMSEEEIINYNNLKTGKVLFSLEDIKEYHEHVRKLLRNVAEIEKELLKQFSDVCSPGSYKVIKEIVEEVCGDGLYLKGMWGKS
tara:strand:+ start:857 stop:1180 length:324 start_codon:yes stop_codon:yes gene_type:complete